MLPGAPAVLFSGAGGLGISKVSINTHLRELLQAFNTSGVPRARLIVDN